MMYAAPQCYHKSTISYGGTSMTMKQEPVEDLLQTDRPVDMSLPSRDHKHRTHLDIPRGYSALSYDNDQLYGFNISLFHHRQKSHTSVKDMDSVQKPSLEHHPLAISSLTPPSGINGIHPLDNGDEKLVVNEVMGKNSRATAFSEADMLAASSHQRAKREFVPDNKKDDSYWCKRIKNNDSARRSRVKRKAMEKMMETRLLELQKENIELKHEVASLRRHYGEEEGSTSDSSSSREKTSTRSSMSRPAGPEDGSSKLDEDQQSSGSDDPRSSDDSRTYSMRSVTSLTHSLGTVCRDRADSIGSISSSLTSGRISTNSRPNSRSSQVGCPDVGLRTDVTGALDLTSDCSNRSTPGWESSSSESFTSISTNSNRRNSCISSDSNSLEDASTRIMIFPLKCRWKKEKLSAYSSLTEELQ